MAMEWVTKEGANMKLKVTLIVIIAAITLLGVPSVSSQSSQIPGAIPQFDAKREVRLSGRIQEVKVYSCPVTGTVGTHLELQTSEGPIEVHVAGARFLQQYGIRFDVGQTVEMIGVKGTFDGRSAFLPRIIMISNDTYYLRDKTGQPLW